MTQDPDLKEAYFAKIAVAIAQKDFSEAVGALKMMDAKRPLPLENLESLPQLNELTESREYLQWKQSRAKLKAVKATSPGAVLCTGGWAHP